MRKSACLLFLMAWLSVPAQQADLSARMAGQELVQYRYPEKKVRKFIQFRSAWTYLNPLTYVGGGLMFFYQNVISDQFQASCLYQVSCSEFTKLSIQRYGMVRGTLRGLSQFTECQHGALEDHPPIMISDQHQIKNQVEALH